MASHQYTSLLRMFKKMIIRRTFSSIWLLRRTHYHYHSFYDVLEVDAGASQLQIKRKFYELAKKYHPDTQDGVKDPSKFIKINQAYETLGDQKKRANYDNNFFSAQRDNSYHHYYQHSQGGFRRPFSGEQERYYSPPVQPFITILKNNIFTIFFYSCLVYMGITVFKYFLVQMDKNERQFKQMILDNSASITQRRRQYYTKQMELKGVYGQYVDLKYRSLVKESTRSIQKRKKSLAAIKGIQKQGKPWKDIVIKPEYM